MLLGHFHLPSHHGHDLPSLWTAAAHTVHETMETLIVPVSGQQSVEFAPRWPMTLL